MTGRHGFALLLLGLAAPTGMAGAQEVIRCGNAYGQQPCAGGSAVQAADPRSPAQRAQAAAVIQRDARLADAMEEARLKEEAQAEEARGRNSQPAAQMRAAAAKPQRSVVFKAGSARPGDKARKAKSKSNGKAASVKQPGPAKTAAAPRAMSPPVQP